jgi:hypothetical protein
MGGIIHRTSLLDLDVPLSWHPAPEFLSVYGCAYGVRGRDNFRA